MGKNASILLPKRMLFLTTHHVNVLACYASDTVLSSSLVCVCVRACAQNSIFCLYLNCSL